jgi:hypothetical protein
MKTIFATVCLFAVALASPVQAKGCIKGAIVGGVAGHMAGRVLHGNPGKPGLYTVRLKMPANSKMPVHSHPDERVRVIISGTYYSALGASVDASKLLSFPPGTFSHVPPKVWQFAETETKS